MTQSIEKNRKPWMHPKSVWDPAVFESNKRLEFVQMEKGKSQLAKAEESSIAWAFRICEFCVWCCRDEKKRREN